MPPSQLVFVGPHGAGKTTIGRRVAALLGWPFDEEIGRRLRDEALAANPGAHALRAQGSFDERVILAELARDRTAASPRVVETWHPGNLSCAVARGSAAAARLRAAVAAAVAEAPPTLVQPLAISARTALRRLSEPGPDPRQTVRFFLRVGHDAALTARALGLPVLPPLWTDGTDADRAAHLVVERLGVALRYDRSLVPRRSREAGRVCSRE